MVKIRLKRMGSKFNANYKIVVADARAPRDGKFIEALGNYDPHSKAFSINEELTKKWLEQGAQLTDTVYALFRKHKLNVKFNKVTKKSDSKEKAPKKEVKKVVKETTTKTKTTTTKKTTPITQKASTKKATK